MAGIMARNFGTTLLTLMKWILWMVSAVWKLAFGIAKLFLLLLALAVRVVLAVTGISAGRL